MKILVVDDHAVVRQGLKLILSEGFPKATIAEAQNATEALELIWKQNWNLVLLDITLPGRSGLDVLPEVKRARPKAAVLVLSMYPEAEFAVRALKNGAAGYITKKSAADELVRAAKQVLAGGRYVTAALAQKLAADLATGGDKPLHEALSTREFQVMQLLAAGKTVKEIAADVSLSFKTVSTYRTRILAKLSLQSNVAIARYALQHRLVD